MALGTWSRLAPGMEPQAVLAPSVFVPAVLEGWQLTPCLLRPLLPTTHTGGTYRVPSFAHDNKVQGKGVRARGP